MAGIPPVLTSSFVDNTTLHLGLVAVAGLIVCGFDMLLGDRPVATCYQILGRSNELGTTLGLPANRLRFSCGALQGLCLGVAGVLSASYYSIIEPRQFAVSLSVMILVVSYFRRSWRGATGAGAFMLVGLPEALRLVGWSSDRAAAMQLLLSGIVGMVFCFSSLRGQRL
jgi:ribose/xylose/arabinose/galactoside ABC-type transport system permease subunit